MSAHLDTVVASDFLIQVIFSRLIRKNKLCREKTGHNGRKIKELNPNWEIVTEVKKTTRGDGQNVDERAVEKEQRRKGERERAADEPVRGDSKKCGVEVNALVLLSSPSYSMSQDELNRFSLFHCLLQLNTHCFAFLF